MLFVFTLALFLLPTLVLGVTVDPFTDASRATGIPVRLLVAISKVESSHHPWALNMNGKAIYPQSQKEAEEILIPSPENTDIGLMQINYRVWGRRLGLTKTQLLDSRINVWIAAFILRHHLSQYPFWEAIGRYHSADRNRQVGYAWRVYQMLLNNQGLPR